VTPGCARPIGGTGGDRTRPRLATGEWIVDENAPKFFWVADAQDYIESVKPD